MPIFKTVTTWDHQQTMKEFEPIDLESLVYINAGLTVGGVTITSAPGALPIIKERTWTTEDAANRWAAFVMALPIPPVSCVVVVE